MKVSTALKIVGILFFIIFLLGSKIIFGEDNPNSKENLALTFMSFGSGVLGTMFFLWGIIESKK